MKLRKLPASESQCNFVRVRRLTAFVKRFWVDKVKSRCALTRCSRTQKERKAELESFIPQCGMKVRIEHDVVFC